MRRHIINFILIIVLIFSGYQVVNKLLEYRKGQVLYDEISDIKTSIINESKNKDEEEIVPLDLSNINEDYISWIQIEDSKIDYPIVKAEDNEYYLYRDINEEYLAAGSIFMDFRNNKFEDLNTVIYGHNMRDGSMFADIKKFKDIGFAEDNNIEIITKTGEIIEYEVFSVYVTDASVDYIQTEFPSDVEYGQFLEERINDSLIDFGIELDTSDKIITLSTCSYEFDDARTVVHGKLVEDKEETVIETE